MTNSQGGFELVLGNRQLVTAVFALTIQTGLVGGLAYVAGRSIGVPGRSEAPQIVVVDSPSVQAGMRPALTPPAAKTAEPAPAPKPSAAREATPAAPAAVVKPADPKPSAPGPAVFREPERGQSYLQVAAVERGVAEVFAEVLTRKGFTPLVARGAEEKIFRILVGPVRDREHMTALQGALSAAGFSSFPRRY